MATNSIHSYKPSCKIPDFCTGEEKNMISNAKSKENTKDPKIDCLPKNENLSTLSTLKIQKNRFSGNYSFFKKNNFNEMSENIEKIKEFCKDLSEKYKLSTTGYQQSMTRINEKNKPDDRCFMTLERAFQYRNYAKEIYPEETLKKLVELQKDYIYQTCNFELKTAIEMNNEELFKCLLRCREKRFANCDIQALEIAIFLKFSMKIKDFYIYSNKKISHNYIVIPAFLNNKDTIIDSWTGLNMRELDLKTKISFSHFDANLKINKNMHDFLEFFELKK